MPAPHPGPGNLQAGLGEEGGGRIEFWAFWVQTAAGGCCCCSAAPASLAFSSGAARSAGPEPLQRAELFSCSTAPWPTEPASVAGRI